MDAAASDEGGGGGADGGVRDRAAGGGAPSAYFAVEADNALGREKKRNEELTEEKDRYQGLLQASADQISDFSEQVDSRLTQLPGSNSERRRLLLEKRWEY